MTKYSIETTEQYNQRLAIEAEKTFGFATRYDENDCPLDAAWNWFTSAQVLAIIAGDYVEAERCKQEAIRFNNYCISFGLSRFSSMT